MDAFKYFRDDATWKHPFGRNTTPSEKHPAMARELPNGPWRHWQPRGRSAPRTWHPISAGLARLRACVEQLSAGSPAVRIGCSQGGGVDRAPCAQAFRSCSHMPKLQRRPLSPPGCLRTRLGVAPSLSWRLQSGPAARGRNTRFVALILRGHAYCGIARGQPILSIFWRNFETSTSLWGGTDRP